MRYEISTRSLKSCRINLSRVEAVVCRFDFLFGVVPSGTRIIVYETAADEESGRHKESECSGEQVFHSHGGSLCWDVGEFFADGANDSLRQLTPIVWSVS